LEEFELSYQSQHIIVSHVYFKVPMQN